MAVISSNDIEMSLFTGSNYIVINNYRCIYWIRSSLGLNFMALLGKK